jgi:hypothetical protein
MGQNDIGVDKIEEFVFEKAQAVGGILVKEALDRIAVETMGLLDHRRGDVNAMDFREMFRECLA